MSSCTLARVMVHLLRKSLANLAAYLAALSEDFEPSTGTSIFMYPSLILNKFVKYVITNTNLLRNEYCTDEIDLDKVFQDFYSE
jgi:hypothetical protein